MLSLSGCFNSAARATPTHDKVYVFDCEHFGSGKFRYLVTANAIKITNTASGAVALTKAPGWQLSCFRENEKIEWLAPIDRFDPSSMISSRSSTTAKRKSNFTVLGRDKLLGLKCLKYQINDGSIVWVPEDLKTAPQINDLVTRYFRTPAVEAIPIKNFRPDKAIAKATPQSISKAKLQKDIPWLSVKNLRGRPSDNYYINLTAWKQIPYKESDFAYPKGFRRTENLKEIILSQKSRQALEDLVEGLSQ